MFKKIVTFFLCIAIVFSSCYITALAARPSGEKLLTDTASVNAWDAWLDANIRYGIDLGKIEVSEKARYWAEMDKGIAASGAGLCSDYETLLNSRDSWNGAIASFGNLFNLLMHCISNVTLAVPTATLAYDDDLGVYRLREYHSNLWLVNSSGHFPYFRPESADESQHIGQWLPYDQAIASSQALWHTVIGADLSAYAESWPDRSSRITESEDYFYLVWNDPNQHRKAYVLCDDYGYPYYVPKPKQTAVTTPNNYYTEQGDSYTDDSTNVNVYDQGSAFLDSILDVENGILNVGGEAYYVDEINYDDSTKTYYVDSHDSYTWSPTFNTYITNNYKWEITYNIDYTSVTYIGQTEEYEERYEYYYELPDGRSSADLTAEDLEQLSVVFHDVMNYSRTADDSALRALYHFDGNTEDSSYWSYTRHGFEWKKGASLTYMDEGVFNGSLYLDETEHHIEIGLPGNDVATDWTVQFRYYQSHTEAPVMDSSFFVGGDELLFFDGANYYDKNKSLICATSVGVWNEICLMRSGNTLYYYINGVCYRSVEDTYHYPHFGFYFGTQQQTYKKLDEIRFTERAIYTPGANYTPSAVPFDTNLALVLPDAASAVADEIVSFKKSPNNLLTPSGLDTWNVWGAWTCVPFQNWSSESYMWNFPVPGFPTIFVSPYEFTGMDGDGVIWYHTSAADPVVVTDNFTRDLGGHFFLPVYASSSWDPLTNVPRDENRVFGASGDFYCYSVLLSDGTYSYITFDGNLNVVDVYNGSRVTLAPNYIGNTYLYWDDYHQTDLAAAYYYAGISVYGHLGGSVDIVHMELVQGLKPQFELDIQTVIYDADTLTDSPILAVRSNRPITSYQIGGVRPSYPEKGQVYAMVENNRIISLQQYTGFVWEAVDGRIWTGSRWIPYSSFDVKTLQDFWDVEGTTSDDYFYSESGFWAWFQRQWKTFMEKVDKIIFYLRESVGLPEESDCEHVYTGEETPPSCSTPGGTVYTCENCGHVLLESTPALGHDWVVIEDVPSEFNLLEDVQCPDCSSEDFTYELNATQDEFACTCTVCDREWKETPDVVWGHTTSKCSRCGVTQTESKDPNDNGLFTALGNFLADGIDWILDKLAELVESITGIQDTFKDFAIRMKENVGQYPAFLAAAIAVLPGELTDVIWFAVVALVAVAVFKKVTR